MYAYQPPACRIPAAYRGITGRSKPHGHHPALRGSYGVRDLEERARIGPRTEPADQRVHDPLEYYSFTLLFYCVRSFVDPIVPILYAWLSPEPGERCCANIRSFVGSLTRCAHADAPRRHSHSALSGVRCEVRPETQGRRDTRVSSSIEARPRGSSYLAVFYSRHTCL